MNYECFSREQLESALNSLKIENITHLNTISKLKKELKDIKGRCSSFEEDSLDRRDKVRRSTVH
jgi:hypothetical protein